MTIVLAVGDVVGKPGRKALEELLPRARDRFNPDLVLVNGENAAGGFGLTRKIFDEFTGDLGIDAVTMGNHWHDKKEIYDFMSAPRLVLPANMGNVADPQQGYRVIETKGGQKFAVFNVIGRAFMHGENSDPFACIDKMFGLVPERIKLRIVDIHAEASSEKQGLAHYLCGRASLVYGTHSHVPTGDERILADKTGYITDLGMTGAYDSVIGMRKEAAIQRLITGEKKRLEPATADLWLCFVIADCDPITGYCQKIERHRWELNNFTS